MRHITIRPYHPAKDEQAVFALWNSLLGDTWPLSFHTFHNITLDSIAYQEGDHLIAEDEHTILGFLTSTPCFSNRQSTNFSDLLRFEKVNFPQWYGYFL